MRPILPRLITLAAAGIFLAAAPPCLAQTVVPDGLGHTVPGAVQMCVSAGGLAVPCALQDAVPQPGVTAPLAPASPDQRAAVVAISPNSGSPGAYPSGALPITGNGAGSTGAVVGTLAALTGRLTYICGFDVSAIGGTAAVGPITVAGLKGSSMVYQMSSTAAGLTLSRTFTPCIPASAVNTAITITTTADGSATAVDVNSWGYQQ